MGLQKERFIIEQDRGYGFSNKQVCGTCFGDKYLSKLISHTGKKGCCSYCRYENGKRKYKNVLPLEEVMPYIMETIKSEFFESENMLPWDSENKEYIGNSIDVYDLVYEELNRHMECENEGLLQEIYDNLIIGDQVSKYDFEKRQEEMDYQEWKKFCKLVQEQKFSPDEIIDAAFGKDISDELLEIRSTLELIETYSQELHMVEAVYTGLPIYRCRNDIEEKSDKSEIHASDIGTAPKQYASENRMSARGDMMFYGASRKKTAFAEIGAKEGDVVTTGRFYLNKRIRVLNLHRLYKHSCPSIFDAPNRGKRSLWFFYKMFMEDISKPVTDCFRGVEYKPTQVLTKFVQKRMKLHGIMYNSSHAALKEDKYTGVNGEECFVLFVDHQSCIDEGEKVNKKELQLILRGNPTQERV